MSAQIIDGKAIAMKVRQEVGEGVAKLKRDHSYIPGLATVLVGHDPASASYVRSKHKACEALGMRSISHNLAEDVSQAEVEGLVKQLSEDPEVDGILVQLPLPSHFNEEAVLNCVDVKKDVDGFHPINVGRLVMKGRDPHFLPCTPHGCMVMLDEIGVDVAGKYAVVVGRSNIVGLPVALMLQARNATVTICHSRTQDLQTHLKMADIVVAAVGRTEMITGEMLKPGVVVIDVGINYKDDSTRKRGYRLVGDVHFDSAKEVASAITPVPGGVGPMTIAMLMHNTLRAAQIAVS